MRLNHPDYIKLVIETYNKKRTNNQLSLLLAHSTAAKIKKECLNVFKDRYDVKDEQLIKTFFEPLEQGKDLLQVLRKFDPDKFKPLNNYLKGLTETTDDKNVELLAWLIDFQHRPYIYGKDVQLSDEERIFIQNNDQNKTVNVFEETDERQQEDEEENSFKRDEVEKQDRIYGESPVIVHEVTKSKTVKDKSKRSLIIFLILIIYTGGIYITWQHKQDEKNIMGVINTGCMYWTGVHYEPVSCNEKGKGLLFPLDEEKMKSFRKITRKDTITEWSIGKLYYIQNKKDIECYTEGGYYPEDPKRMLRVLSRHIYDKYLNIQRISGKDSLGGQNIKLITNR